MLVDHLGAAGAGDVHADQFALDGRRREPFVPQRDGKAGEVGEIAGKGAGRLRARPSLPSMLMGRPSTKPTALRSPDIANNRAASALNALRWIVSTPVASRRSG